MNHLADMNNMLGYMIWLGCMVPAFKSEGGKNVWLTSAHGHGMIYNPDSNWP